MRTALAIALGLVSAAALAQVTQTPVTQPSSLPPTGTATASPDGGAAPVSSAQSASDAGPATRPSRTGDQAATQPAQRIYSFDPLPIGTYSFEAPPPATSQSGPSSTPR